MKITKLGTIRFTEKGLPIFEGFTFIPETEEEEQMLRTSKAYFLQKEFEVIIQHITSVYNRNAAKLDEYIEEDIGFDRTIGHYTKSPVDVVNAFLVKVSKP